MTGENAAESNGPLKSFAETFTPRLVEALRSNYTLADLKGTPPPDLALRW